MLAGLQVGRLRASTPGGVGSVANTGLGKVRFWKCGNSREHSEAPLTARGKQGKPVGTRGKRAAVRFDKHEKE